MGLLDRFRDAPAPPSTPRAKGRSGRAHYGGYLELEELNTDLVGFNGLRVYDRMWRTDPDVRRSLAMVCNPIVAGTWTVTPYGGDDADEKAQRHAQFIEWLLFSYMRPALPLHLAEAVPLFARSGFAPFEQIWGAAEWEGQQVLVPRKLDVRLPRTIEQWNEDKLGELAEIVQFLPVGEPERSGRVTLRARDLLYYRVGAEGNNWEGVSILRPAYKPWYLKDKVERLDAIAQEREATGIPVVYPPTNTNDEQLDGVETALKNLKAGEEAYVVMPGPHAQDLGDDAASQGWRLEVLGLSGGAGGTRSAEATLKYHSDKIAAALIAEFMRLGQGGEGARATADVQQDPFYAGVEALASLVEGPWNDELIPRIVALNFADADGAPSLSMEKADSTSLGEMQSFVSGLVGSGILTPDHELEDWLRDVANMPPADPQERERREQEREENRQLQVEGQKKALEEPAVVVQPGKPGEVPVKPKEKPPKDPKKAAAFARQARQLRWWEELMELDRIEDLIDNARERFQDGAGGEAQQLAARMAVEVARGLTPAEDDLDELEAAIAEQLQALYVEGRQTVADELVKQGAPRQTYSFAEEDRPPLERRARRAARTIAQRIARTLEELVLGRDRPRQELTDAANVEAAAALKGEAQAHAAPALNEGRGDEADARADEIRGTRYTSILDGNRCPECRTADTDTLVPLADPGRIKPPNPDCHGGGRCRCLEFFELAEERAPGA